MAQTRFEVASVRVSNGGPPGGRFQIAHGTLNAKNVVLKLLIGMAYAVDGFRITGLSASMDAERFDFEAKAGFDATKEQMMPMLRVLLEERFKL